MSLNIIINIFTLSLTYIIVVIFIVIIIPMPNAVLDTALRKSLFCDLVNYMMYFQAILKSHITISLMAWQAPYSYPN